MLSRNTIVALSVAAFMTVGTSAFAADSPPPTAGENASHAEGGLSPDEQQHAKTEETKTMKGGMAADHVILKELREWKSTPDKAPDALFALQAGCGNMWEIDVAKLVQEKAQDQQVKDTAAEIEKDHTAAQQKLEPIAQKLGVTYPTELPAEKQAVLNIYRELPADKLEAVFLSSMRADHLAAVNMYSDESKSAQDPDLKAYATETLPVIEHHTAMLIKDAQSKGMDTVLHFDGSMSMKNGDTDNMAAK